MDAAQSSSAPSHGLVSLLELHRAELRRFLEAHCESPADAEDLLQELWIKASSLAIGPVGNGRAYLFRMANNLAIDHYRARTQANTRQAHWLDSLGRGGVPADEIADPAPSAESALAEQQETEALARAIFALPPGARRALTLYRLDGLGHADVARAMGISRSGVEKHLIVAMRHLRKFFGDRDSAKCGARTMAPSNERQKHSDARQDRVQ